MSSDLSFIKEGPEDPIQLFQEWLKDATDNGRINPRAVSVSTSSSTGNVNNRHLLIRRIESDGIVITTDRRSMKGQELSDNPIAAVACLWEYKKDGKNVSRQVRMKASVAELPAEKYVEIYNAEPLYCKLRSHACRQGQETDRIELLLAVEKLRKEFESGKNLLPMPAHYVGYKLTPTMYDFYHANENQIADRLGYRKEDNQWIQLKLAA